MELKKIVLLPIPTGWRDSNSPMGDGLYSAQWVFTKFIAHLCCYFNHTETYYLRNVFWTFFVVWSEENRFDTHFNELDGYQQSHRWCSNSHRWVVTKKVDQKWLIERQETLSLLNSMRTQKRASHEWWSWKNPLSLDRPLPMGLLESLQPVGMGSKTNFSNSMTK